MGEWYCSRFATMQLFHELKQQFPTLPDHVVSQCIVQNNYDRESCARSLRATEELRPPPGAFPPPPPRMEPAPLSGPSGELRQDEEFLGSPTPKQQRRSLMGPLSLDLGLGPGHKPGPSSAPTGLSFQGPLTVDVACCPIEDSEISEELLKEFSMQNDESLQRPALVLAEPLICAAPEFESTSSTSTTIPEESGAGLLEPSTVSSMPRGFTSINVTLKPPVPSELRGPASSSSESSNPPDYQSNLNVSLNRGSFGSRLARSRPPPIPQRPNTLVYPSGNLTRPVSGLPEEFSSQSTVSAPTTPLSVSAGILKLPMQPSSSLPTTPSSSSLLLGPPTSDLVKTNRGAIPRRYVFSTDGEVDEELTPESVTLLEEVDEQYKPLIEEQLTRYGRLDKALETDKEKLENLRKEVEDLTKLIKFNPFYENIKQQLQSEIYQLRLECDKLTAEIDCRGDSRIPLGETNAEFYQRIYTGQQFNPNQLNSEPSNVPPPLPSRPPACEPQQTDNQEDQDGPSWVCQRCTFNNHPLLNSCEECYLPRPIIIENSQGMQIRNANHQFLTVLPSFPSTSR